MKTVLSMDYSYIINIAKQLGFEENSKLRKGFMYYNGVQIDLTASGCDKISILKTALNQTTELINKY